MSFAGRKWANFCPSYLKLVTGPTINLARPASYAKYTQPDWKEGAEPLSDRTLLNVRRYTALETATLGQGPDWIRLNPDGSVQVQWNSINNQIVTLLIQERKIHKSTSPTREAPSLTLLRSPNSP